MTDMTEWVKERRRIHNAATEGPWAVDGPAQAGPDDSMVVYPKDDAGAIAYVQPAWDDADAIVDAHNVAVPVLLTAVENVLELLSPHYESQVRREAKFGRKGSACVCEVCRAMEAVEGAINE